MKIQYSHLNTIQLGAFGEAFAKMSFILEGFEVYDTEYDDRGVDFIVRNKDKIFYEVQVKTTGTTVNPFVYENKFKNSDTFLFCAVRIIEGELPTIYLAKGSDWEKAFQCLRHNPSGGNSGAYFEMSFAKKYQSELEKFQIESYIKTLIAQPVE